MKIHMRWLISVAALCAVLAQHEATAQEWHAGTWDSTVYNLFDHPKTVALRIEVRDVNTGLPIRAARVELKGQYTDDTIGPGDFDGTPRSGPQAREFSMSAQTDPDGIAVFALGWNKQYPWDLGAPVNYDVHTSWIRPVDDIEKVQRMEIRHPDYQQKAFAISFRHLTEVGQASQTQRQEQKVIEAFRNAWSEEMTREDVRFCVLRMGRQFKDFQNRKCTKPEFFAAIRDKQFGTVYTKPQNWFSFGASPQAECGPYFVYLAETSMERIASRVEVIESVSHGENRRESETVRPASPKVESPQERPVPWINSSSAGRSEPDKNSKPRENRPRVIRTEVQPETAQPQTTPEVVKDNIGLAIVQMSDELHALLKLYPGIRGPYIGDVASESKADKAGLRKGMVIESVDQRFVGNPRDYLSLVQKKKSGDQFDITVWVSKGDKKWERSIKRVSM